MRGLSEENPLLNQDFRDMLSAFCEEKVEFMVIGAYALAFYGFPRATGDIDLCSSKKTHTTGWRTPANWPTQVAKMKSGASTFGSRARSRLG